MDRIINKQAMEALLLLAKGVSIHQAAKKSGVRYRNLHYLAKLWMEIGYLKSERKGRELLFKPTEKGCGIIGAYIELLSNLGELKWDSTEEGMLDRS